jgi:hypothetical protein
MSKETEDVQLSDAQIERVAKRAAVLAVEQTADMVLAKIQQEIGRSAIRAIFWMGGAIMAAAVAWLAHKGYINVPVAK